MKRSLRFGSKDGVTLVELLVVMLIIVILAVSLTPLFRDYIIQAQYAAEAVPVVASMRTKVTLLQYDKAFLPGIPRTGGRPVATAGGAYDPAWPGAGEAATSLLRPGTVPSQTFSVVPASDPIRYEAAVVNGISGVDFATEPVQTEDTGDHFSNDLKVDYEHFTGNRLRPSHVFYRSDYAGYKQGGYAYCVGVFGDGDGLAVGTGYAVLEILNPNTQTKIVATWERWRSVNSSAGQITFMNADEYAMPTNPADLQRENVCWIGDIETLVTSIVEAEVRSALDNLAAAGWKF